MGKRIEKTMVFAVILLYQISFISNASAGLFDWTTSRVTENKYSSVDYLKGGSVSFHEINNWGKRLVNQSAIPEEPRKEIKILKTYTVRATGYSSTPDQTDDTPFTTASGTHVRDGVMAANFLPFGTKVRIPDVYGDKIFVIEDRMNKRYWLNIDIWFPERSHALTFGSKRVIIEVVEES